MKRSVVVALGLVLALGTVRAQTEDQPRKEDPDRAEYSKLIPQVARILDQLPEAQREEIKKRLVELESIPERVAYLREILEQGAGEALPPELPKSPEELRDRLMKEAMAQFQKMSPEQRAEMMKQAQQFMEIIPPEQRQELMKNFMRGMTQPKLDGGDDEPKKDGEPKEEEPEWMQEARRYADEAMQLYEAWQAMPPETREQMVNDLVEGLKIYFEDNVQPEIDRELARLQRQAQQAMEEFEKFQQLPREEQRRVARERLEKLARRLLGEEEKKDEDY